MIRAGLDLASIIIPHYRTPELLDLCLRLLRRYTASPHEIVVVDNGSDEATVEALRRRQGITLLERRQDPAELGQGAHKAALDLGIERARGRYVVTLHSDTFVLQAGWLDFLVRRLEEGGHSAFGPTTHRLYPASPWERLRGREPERVEWIRPVFTIYRADVFEKLRFVDYPDVGQLTATLVTLGQVGFLSRTEAAHWAFHMGGMTRLTVLDHRRTAKRRKARRFERFLARPEIRSVLEERP